jgi:hypothetical protein
VLEIEKLPNGQRSVEGEMNPTCKNKNAIRDATTLLTTMMQNALPLYKTFGDAQVRLLRNADDQTQFLQVIEYQTDRTVNSIVKTASDQQCRITCRHGARFFPERWSSMYMRT